MRNRVPKTLILAVAVFLTFLSPAIAQQQKVAGVIVVEKNGLYVIATQLGYSCALWMGGWLPVGEEQLVGRLNSLGMQSVYTRNGNEIKFFIEDVYLSKEQVLEKLRER